MSSFNILLVSKFTHEKSLIPVCLFSLQDDRELVIFSDLRLTGPGLEDRPPLQPAVYLLSSCTTHFSTEVIIGFAYQALSDEA